MRAAAALLLLALCLPAQQSPRRMREDRASAADVPEAGYLLGPGDQIAIWALGAAEMSESPVRVDGAGDIDLPMLGRVHAAGLTAEQLKRDLLVRLKTYVEEPSVSISITEYRSEPVSVIGAVNDPGVHRFVGKKTLVEVLSLAGGLRSDSGNTVKITRALQWGPIPLPTVSKDETGAFSVADVSVSAIMEAKNPEYNILIKPHDIISIPKALMIYVMGEVGKPGGFVLNERDSFTALQAVSMAGGITHVAAPQNARILRATPGSRSRQELPMDLRKILDGRAGDVPLQPEDIVFIPGSRTRGATIRAVEAAIQVGTGVVIWRR